MTSEVTTSGSIPLSHGIDHPGISPVLALQLCWIVFFLVSLVSLQSWGRKLIITIILEKERRKTDEGREKDEGKKKKTMASTFWKSGDAPLFIRFLKSSYIIGIIHISLPWVIFFYLWHKADFAVSAIKTVNIKITETVKVKKCVQEAQKTELIYCPVASLQYQLLSLSQWWESNSAISVSTDPLQVFSWTALTTFTGACPLYLQDICTFRSSTRHVLFSLLQSLAINTFTFQPK